MLRLKHLYFKTYFVNCFPGPEVEQKLHSLLLPASVFILIDSLMCTQEGLLRGMGLTGPASAAKVVGMFLIRIPLAYALAFPGQLGVEGIWYSGIISSGLTGSYYAYLLIKSDH